MNNHQFPTPEDRTRLCAAALAATAKAFLTKEGGTRYGAAVLTRSGAIFSSGQYSSFNHVTNVHAEQAALLIAAMAGEPDILALAVASTGDTEVTRPCGVCRQVMLEHSARTGRDFIVLMVGRTEICEEFKVSQLLPHSWAAKEPSASKPSSPDVRPAGGLRRAQAPGGAPLRTADLVCLKDGAIAMIWDPHAAHGKYLAKIKYAPSRSGSLQKLPHSFSDSLRYESELIEFGWGRDTGFGPVAAMLSEEDLTGVYPSQRASESLPPLAQFLEVASAAGIQADRIGVTGSRALGIATPDSDFDLVIRASPEETNALRTSLLSRLSQGRASIPEQSGTWKLVSQSFPGGTPAILAQTRFAETLTVGPVRIAIILIPLETAPPLLPSQFHPLGHTATSGIVVEATNAPYKRSTFLLREPSGRQITICSYHKLANLVREGDRLALRGWEVDAGPHNCIIQLALHRDNLVWLP